MDEMILWTQKWLNITYGNRTGFGWVDETGTTGWPTIYALTRALQIELGITETANNFGDTTSKKFIERWPEGITPSDDENNVYGIIQGTLWCKGYEAEYGGITPKFSESVRNSIIALKSDIGVEGDATVDLELMKELLSMDQFKLLGNYGAKEAIRHAQQRVNRMYRDWTDIIPTDGLYGRKMNKALIQVLQALEGYSPEEATGNFGSGTRSKLKNISETNSDSYPEWVWLAGVALLCNGVDILPSENWNSETGSAISVFQSSYCIPRTEVLDATTWMSLLTSCGDPDRACTACDTRFEITDELADFLIADGYRVVGRYLSEPDQESLSESDYFKALRKGELERIVAHGLQYFPIFQEYSTKLEYFTPESGKQHAEKARAAALRLGIPKTTIYFAVDYDATDTEVTSNILPYFKAVHENLGSSYRVGIYASRNICARVAENGYSVASFVSDMSTGFSGNLGFEIPSDWVYDQFHEISGYHGKWDLDKVAFSKRNGAVGSVIPPAETEPPEIIYELPPAPSTENLTDIMDVIPLISRLENEYQEWRDYNLKENPHNSYVPGTISQGVLNYLAGVYIQKYNFAVSGTVYDTFFADYLDQNDKDLVDNLKQYIGENRVELCDAVNGKNDLAHKAFTLYCYAYANIAPEHWTGWGGDLANGMDDLHQYMIKYPSLDRQKAANAIIGGDISVIDDYLQENEVSIEGIGMHCNYTDLCDDADAIRLGNALKAIELEEIRTLSDLLVAYYGNLTPQYRYTAFMEDGLDYSSADALENSIWIKMKDKAENYHLGGAFLDHLAGDSTDEERQACSNALSHYLLIKSN